ncbi:Rv3235 family protein [Pseudonocardia sp. RS010]|uniref:Rv3235 family protein n=1 Tax=Pseudonocardia sp. RS010 TaxID=3385979 RepID=UPI0039A02262
MTLTAPAPALPLFDTVAYEPALEPLDPEVPSGEESGLLEGDPPPGGAGAEALPPPSVAGAPVGGTADGDAAGNRAAAGNRVAAGSRAAGSRAAAGAVAGPRRREHERTVAARRRAELIVRTALEVLDGRRPVRHLAPYAAPEVLRYVSAGVPRRGRAGTGGASLRSLHVSLPARADAEVAAVCRFGSRVRALAARLELTGRGEWRCVALRVI